MHLKHLLIVLLGLIPLSLSAQTHTIQTDGSITVEGRIPAIHGCEKIYNDKERRACNDRVIAEYVAENIRRPSVGRNEVESGKVKISLVIDTSGGVRMVQLIKLDNNSKTYGSLSPENNEEAKRLLKDMSKHLPVWQPAFANRQLVTSRYLLELELNYPPEKTPEQRASSEIFKIVDKMPLFPHSTPTGDYRTDKGRADSTLFAFLKSNKKYPVAALAAKQEEVVRVSFIVGADGTITNPKLLGEPSPLLGAEAYRLVKAMQKEDHWTPAEVDNLPVRCQFILPISFNVERWEKQQAATRASWLGHPLEPGDTGQIYKVVEYMPLPPFCRELSGNYGKHRSCADRKMVSAVYDELKFPEAAVAAGIEGTVVVSFVVETDGRITSMRVTRNLSPELDREALRAMDKLAHELRDWYPGIQSGEQQRVQISWPVKFRLPR